MKQFNISYYVGNNLRIINISAKSKEDAEDILSAIKTTGIVSEPRSRKDLIIDAVCEEFSLHREEVLSKTRLHPYIFARQIIQYLLFKYVISSPSVIARDMGVDHGTIINSVNSVTDQLCYDSNIRRAVSNVEKRLKKDKII